MRSGVAYRILVMRSRAVVPFGAREGLLSARKMSSQLIQEPLCAALLVMSSA